MSAPVGPPQVEMHDSSDWKLFVFPPQPPYENSKHRSAFWWKSEYIYFIKTLYHHFSKAASTKCERDSRWHQCTGAIADGNCHVTEVEEEEADLVEVEPGDVARADALVLHQAALVCNRCHIYGVKMKFRCCEHRL